MRPEFSRSIWRAVAVGVTAAGLAVAMSSCSKQGGSNADSSSTGATGGVQPAPMAPSGSSGAAGGSAASAGG
nr:hypothetical protein WS71_25555 [Burkholderia mayonis]